MAATLIEENGEEIAVPNKGEIAIPESKHTLEEVMEPEGSTTEAPAEEADELPEKYRGKSIEDVVAMHVEAEKLSGRQSQEVGELRKVVDTYISSQLQTSKPEPPEEEIDFFAEPEKAMARAIESHPAVISAQAQSAEMRKQTSLSQLKQKHPDMQDVLQDPGFTEWVGKSNIRKQLFRHADEMYDFDAADELISLYKERQGIAKQTQVVEKQARKQQARAAATGTAQGSGAPKSRKIYRRADLIKLMKTDPDRYHALSDEILLAYKEKRVK